MPMSLISESAKSNSDDRRSKRRFTISQEVKYRLLYGERIGEAGSGKTLNISSTGVCFTTDAQLAPGLPVELAIQWPALLRGSVQLRLVTYGIVVRSWGGSAVATIDRYEFRTQGLRATA
jgi:PilZ domain